MWATANSFVKWSKEQISQNGEMPEEGKKSRMVVVLDGHVSLDIETGFVLTGISQWLLITVELKIEKKYWLKKKVSQCCGIPYLHEAVRGSWWVTEFRTLLSSRTTRRDRQQFHFNFDRFPVSTAFHSITSSTHYWGQAAEMDLAWHPTFFYSDLVFKANKPELLPVL